MSKKYTNISKKLEISELIHQVVFLIINREDYKSASKILINYEISIEEVSQNTLKLTSFHIDKLAEHLNLN